MKQRRPSTPAATYPAGWFSEPVYAWWPDFEPQLSSARDPGRAISAAATANREKQRQSDNAESRSWATGTLGPLSRGSSK